jgi:excisionase family DNA binding protein
MDDLLTTDEVAIRLRTSPRNVRSLVASGLLRAKRVRPRGQLLFSEADVVAALRQAGQGRIEASAVPGRIET